ncbi:MAG: SAM-dependent methyltransferase [Chitinophagaceae bacterium]
MDNVILLFPSPLSENNKWITDQRMPEWMEKCTCFFVENLPHTRRWIKHINKSFDIDNRTWIELHHHDKEILSCFETSLKTHQYIGIFSDAGCPNVADPGQVIVVQAHKKNIPVIPLIGGNSILLALMASGLNGQRFQFHGYLPIAQKEREESIRKLELLSKKNHATQIFIETPYRNQKLIESILKICHHSTLLCIASNITATEEYIKTKTIAVWKKQPIAIQKIPTVFLLQG